MKQCLLLFLSPFVFSAVVQAYRWSSTLEHNADVSACAGGNVSFPWFIVTDEEDEKILDIDWLFEAPGKDNVSIASYVEGSFFTKADKGRFTFTPNAGLLLQGAQSHDVGRYYVRVNLHDPKCRLTSAERMVTLSLADRAPVAQNGGLRVAMSDAIRDDVTEDWTLQFHCGRFVDLGHPPVRVVWTTPSGEVRKSSHEDNGTFVLSVSSPVQGGNYSCHLPPSTPAARCLPATSPLKAAAQLHVDDRDVRLSFLEARQGELLAQVHQMALAHSDQARRQSDVTEQLEEHVTKLTATVDQMALANSDQVRLLKNQAEEIARLQGLTSAQNDTLGKMEAAFTNMTSRWSMLADVVEETSAQTNLLQNQSHLQNDVKEQLEVLVTSLTTEFSELNEKMNVFLDNPKELIRKRSFSSCVDWQAVAPRSGVRTLTVMGEKISVYCDQQTDGGGWTVFQRRKDGTVDFYRGWSDYRQGFGDLEGSFWLGLDNLHSLTASQSYELRVDLHMFNGTKGKATYSGFYIDGSGHNFALHFDKFTGGNAGDSLSRHNNQPFSTHDADHDRNVGNCASRWRGAWWYHNNCHHCHLNGRYKDSRQEGWEGVVWYAFDSSYSLKFAEMKMRPT